jgi:hypothetical protein
MKRRDLLKSIMLGTAGLTLPGSHLYAAANDTYTGQLLVLLQVTGGWDVTSFCDPKVNQTGEKEITHWSNNAEILTAGNIPFAPFAGNADFFNKYYPHMAVINGVDAQTNSHSTGVLHNWSGRNSEGFPSLTAMFAAHNAPEQPLSYINNGGYGQTANLIRFSRLDDTRALIQILQPEYNNPEDTIRRPEDMARIREYRLNRMTRLIDSNSNTPRRLASPTSKPTKMPYRASPRSLVSATSFLMTSSRTNRSTIRRTAICAVRYRWPLPPLTRVLRV